MTCRAPLRPALATLLLAAAPWAAWGGAQGTPTGVFRIGFQAASDLKAPLAVSFRATLPAGHRVRWIFGDGSGAADAGPTHTYYRPGTYAVQAELLDPQGRVVGRARGEVQVRSAGAEGITLTVLPGLNTLRVTSLGSVLYAPNPVQLSVNGQAVGEGQAVVVSPGPVRVQGRALTSAGQAASRQLSFEMAALAGSVPFESEVVRLTNRARAQGWNCAALRPGGPALPPLKQHALLDVAALAQSASMALAGYFAHESALDGSTPLRRVQAAGLRPAVAAENIAAGQTTPQEVVDGWLRSPGHCHNVMGDFSVIGVSFVAREGGVYKRYWTQVFAKL